MLQPGYDLNLASPVELCPALPALPIICRYSLRFKCSFWHRIMHMLAGKLIPVKHQPCLQRVLSVTFCALAPSSRKSTCCKRGCAEERVNQSSSKSRLDCASFTGTKLGMMVSDSSSCNQQIFQWLMSLCRLFCQQSQSQRNTRCTIIFRDCRCINHCTHLYGCSFTASPALAKY